MSKIHNSSQTVADVGLTAVYSISLLATDAVASYALMAAQSEAIKSVLMEPVASVASWTAIYDGEVMAVDFV